MIVRIEKGDERELGSDREIPEVVHPGQEATVGISIALEEAQRPASLEVYSKNLSYRFTCYYHLLIFLTMDLAL